MTDLLTKLDIKFHDRVNAMQDRFDQLKRAAKSGFLVLEDDVFDYANDIEGAIEAGRERIDAAKNLIGDMTIESQENIDKWRKNRESKKLMREAEKTQHYAEASMEVAISALDEAEWALARALMTRSYAESVAEGDAA